MLFQFPIKVFGTSPRLESLLAICWDHQTCQSPFVEGYRYVKVREIEGERIEGVAGNDKVGSSIHRWLELDRLDTVVRWRPSAKMQQSSLATKCNCLCISQIQNLACKISVGASLPVPCVEPSTDAQLQDGARELLNSGYSSKLDSAIGLSN